MGASEAELEQLYRTRATAYRNAVAAITGGRKAASDVVQDGFAQALAQRDRFRASGTLEGWVWRIILRHALGLRRRKRWPLVSSAELAADAPSPEIVSDPALRDAVRALAPRRRLFVFLHYYADLSYGQIGEACDVAEGTVAAALSQARAELQSALEKELTPRA